MFLQNILKKVYQKSEVFVDVVFVGVVIIIYYRSENF